MLTRADHDLPRFDLVMDEGGLACMGGVLVVFQKSTTPQTFTLVVLQILKSGFPPRPPLDSAKVRPRACGITKPTTPACHVGTGCHAGRGTVSIILESPMILA